MEENKYGVKWEERPNGYYAVIKEVNTNTTVFEQKCGSLEEAQQTAFRELHRLTDK